MHRIAALLLLAANVYSQSRFQIYNTENGLPNDSVLAIRQTRDGYLWFTTYRGLVRFDGVRFQVFDSSNTPVLRGTNFATFSLFEDHNGALWAGTWSSGAVRYQNGTFTAYTTRDGLPNNNVVRVDEDREGAIWIFTHPGLSRLRNGRIETVQTVDGQSIAPVLTTPPDLGLDAYLYGLWRFTPSGLQRFAYGHWTNVPLPPLKRGSRSARMDSLLEDAQGRLWFSLIGSPGKGYCVKDQQLTEFKGMPPGAFINYQDRWGRLWISDHRGRTGWWQAGQFTALKEISTASPYRVLEDREGGFWVGTLEDGLAHGIRDTIQTYRLPGGREANAVEPITNDDRGNIWMGSYGLTRMSSGKFQTFFRSHPQVSWRAAQIPSALFAEHDGSLLCGYPNGLAVFRNGKYEDPETPLLAIKSEINAILRDRAGDLWLGGEEGLYRYSHCKLDLFNSVHSSLRGEVRALYEDSQGTLWIGTDVGLCKRKGNSFSCFGPKDELAQWGVRSIIEDADRVIWAGTSRQGILRVDGDKSIFIGARNGLFSDDATAILEDSYGYFWIGCQLGIYRVKRQDLNDFARHRIARVNSTKFGTTDGLNSPDCTGHGQPHGFRSQDGALWFPTKNGIVKIDPRTLQFNRQPPPIVIEGCALEQRFVSCQKQVTLPAGANNFEVRYTALSLIRSDQITFRYQLAGLDNAWIEAGHRRTAYFSHLPPGTFHFSILAANSDGIWNTVGEQLAITVLPHFYQTLWFQLLAAGLGVGLFLFAWQARAIRFGREQALRQSFAQQIIASQEMERKRIAGELHDSLGQHLSVIKNQALLFLNGIAGVSDGHSQVERIASQASQAISEVRQISYNLRPYQLDLLGLTKALEELVKRTCESANIQSDVIIDDLFHAFIKDKEIHFYRIVQECLSNIVKHSQATKARVLVQRSDDKISLVISDNGSGFLAGRHERDPMKGGFGLLGIRERVQLLGGVSTIRSTPGTGTIVSIEFQLTTAGKP